MAVTRLNIKSQQPFALGQSFGEVGAYEQIDGEVHFAVDPNHPANNSIADLKLASRDGNGLVSFSSDFRILKPSTPIKGNRRILFDILNRGRGPAEPAILRRSSGVRARLRKPGWRTKSTPSPSSVIWNPPSSSVTTSW